MRNPAQIRLPEISLSHYLTQLRRSPYSWLILLGTLVGSIVSGCSPIYVLRAAYEEGKILWRREPIANFIQNVEVPQDTNEKLRLVLAVREYARDVLKLNVRGSYSSYSYVDRPDLTYIVVAAPKTELRPYTWWFLIVGSVPYKGYFSKQDAEAEIERLKAEGYDTNMRTSAAFSTLGWFDDPLLSHLLKYDRVMLSEIVFHELFHNTLYLKGASAFNESVANFIGHRASIDFFRERSGEGSAEHLRATQLWDDEREFGAFIAEVAGTLAVLMHYLVYLKDLDLFESIYESSGRNLVRTIEAIRTAVRDRGEPFEALRAWLDKSQTNQSA